MGVYIKGMKMPKDCWHCRFADPEEGGCLVDQKTHGDWDEPDNCPLVDVPPHGRLIDADALRDNNCDAFEIKGVDGTILAMDVSIIDDAPTIIEAEEE